MKEKDSPICQNDLQPFFQIELRGIRKPLDRQGMEWAWAGQWVSSQSWNRFWGCGVCWNTSSMGPLLSVSLSSLCNLLGLSWKWGSPEPPTKGVGWHLPYVQFSRYCWSHLSVHVGMDWRTFPTKLLMQEGAPPASLPPIPCGLV